MDGIILHNTLTGRKEEFIPQAAKNVSMYVCGITPYGESHVGHARCYIIFDTLRRFLEYCGYKVKYVQNITDIDDKIINKSMQTEMTPQEVSEKYFSSFLGYMNKLAVLPAQVYPRVSENIDGIINFIKKLMDEEYAYEKNGSVYFRVSRAEDYGALSGRKRDELVSKDDSLTAQKENPADFALWKKDEGHGWDSPWGKGRPGWHIECSALSGKLLGSRFDIHGGGIDLVFPHHENEIAQSRAHNGLIPAKYWLHNGMVTLKGDKMAKSTGNFFLLKDLLEKVSPMVLRMYLLSSTYRQNLDFDMESIENTSKAHNKLCVFKKELEKFPPDNIDRRDRKIKGAIIQAMRDDMNTAKALGEVFKEATPLLEKIYSGDISGKEVERGRKIVSFVQEVLGISLEKEEDIDEGKIQRMLDKRTKFRKERKFTEADRIRNELSEMGVEIKDTPSGPKWVIR